MGVLVEWLDKDWCEAVPMTEWVARDSSRPGARGKPGQIRQTSGAAASSRTNDPDKGYPPDSVQLRHVAGKASALHRL